MFSGELSKLLLTRENKPFMVQPFQFVFLALLLWLCPDFAVGLIVILQGVVPPITAIPILVERCGGNRRVASQFVVASFIFSVLSIPAFIYLFNKFFPMPL